MSDIEPFLISNKITLDTNNSISISSDINTSITDSISVKIDEQLKNYFGSNTDIDKQILSEYIDQKLEIALLRKELETVHNDFRKIKEDFISLETWIKKHAFTDELY
jgi:hypothetical protein